MSCALRLDLLFAVCFSTQGGGRRHSRTIALQPVSNLRPRWVAANYAKINTSCFVDKA